MIDVCSNANVAYRWFHADGEDPLEVEASRTLSRLSAEGIIALSVIDLTKHEIADAFLRGRAHATAERTALILDALTKICPSITPDAADLHRAIRLAEVHRLTIYDAMYAAVAETTSAQLATLDKALLEAGLGRRPREIVAQLSA